jgi:DNA-directed RNA polymerase II subunit RPB1
LKINNRKQRMRAVLEICKSKTICEGGDELDEENAATAAGVVEPKKKHGGCGGYQPNLKRDGLKITAEFKQVTDDTIEKKQTLTAERVSKSSEIYSLMMTSIRCLLS